jgi:preprotein translocase subunit SecG
MHHKFLFTLAGIFLAIAFIVPTVAFTLQAQSDIEDISQLTNEPGHVTGPNVTAVDPFVVAAEHYNTLVLVLVVEVVFITLAIVMVYLGINHYHGQYDKLKETNDA